MAAAHKKLLGHHPDRLFAKAQYLMDPVHQSISHVDISITGFR
jgi:hypothetical protein